MLSRLLPESAPADALTEAFLAAQADLERCMKSAQEFSGTTVGVSCFNPDAQELWFAHAGDSPVVLGDLALNDPVFGTEGHKAHDKAELKRLEDAGAQVIQKRYEDGD